MKLIYCVLGIIALYGCVSVGTPISRLATATTDF
jgi:hypothetical protein